MPTKRPGRRSIPDASAKLPSARFRNTDPYRARREWLRYEGTAQRDLFRELRERFLLRHAVPRGRVLDLGSGPGRFLPFVGLEPERRVALDLSREMLRMIPGAWQTSGTSGRIPERVLGDALHPPFAEGSWSEVVVFGNTAGFAGNDSERLLAEAERLVAPGGVLLLEIAPGPGERAHYLSRLPPSAVSRLLFAPMRAVLTRLDREGFRIEPERHVTTSSFRRITAEELQNRWDGQGWTVTESLAVAPLLGPDQARIAAVRKDAKAWKRLLELEEEVGRRAERWTSAAAVLISARRPA